MSNKQKEHLEEFLERLKVFKGEVFVTTRKLCALQTFTEERGETISGLGWGDSIMPVPA